MGHWYLDEYGEPKFVDDNGNVRQLGPDFDPYGSSLEDVSAREDAEAYAQSLASDESTAGGPEDIEPGRGSPDIPVEPGAPGTSAKYGYSYSGYDPTEKEKAAKGLAGNIAREQAAAKTGYETMIAPMAEAQGQIEVANADIGLIQEQQALANQRALLEEAKLQHQFANEEARATAAAMGAAHKARMDYLTQVQAYQAMEVNPGQLWGDMETGGRAQALAAVFISDFLGAKGIKTSVMDTINRAIDRSMDSQIAAMNKQGAVAEHFRNLYNFVLSESATEAEARARMRGFYYAAVEKEIAADLAQYDAPMARALTDKALAEIRMGFMQNVAIPLDKMFQDRAQASIDTWMRKYQTDVQASAQRYSVDKQYAADMARLAASTMPADPTKATNAIYDPEMGNFVGNDIGGEVQSRDTRERLEAFWAMAGIAKRIQDFQRTHKPIYDGIGGKWYQDDEEAYIRSLHSQYNTLKTLALSGKAATDTERKAIAEQLPFESIMLNPEKAVAADIVTANDAVRSVINSRVPGAQWDPMPTLQALGFEANDTISGAPPVKTGTDEAFEYAQRPNVDHKEAIDSMVDAAEKSGNPAELSQAIYNIERVLDEAADKENPLEYLDAYGGLDYLNDQAKRAKGLLKKTMPEQTPEDTQIGEQDPEYPVTQPSQRSF